jgi:hypothetical protein
VPTEKGNLAEPEARVDRIKIVLEAARRAQGDPDDELTLLLERGDPQKIAAALVRDAD